MPKVIEGAREKILENARRRLFEKGYQHLSLREVAKESGIATGTIYNYFANKDYLIANIMLGDWQTIVQRMEERISEAASVKEGVFGICCSLEEFHEIYKFVWQQPAVAAAAATDVEHCRHFLNGQIIEKIERLLENKGYGNQKNYTALITEMTMGSIGKSVVTEQFGELLNQLYP